MRRCLGRTRNLTRCQRCGDWRLFCQEHKWQPLIWGFSVVTLVAALAGIYSCFAGATKQDIHSTKTEILQNQQDIYNLLIKQSEINRDKLKTKYPLGYAIFYTDGKEIFAPNDARLQNIIKLSWNNAKIIGYSDNKITMRLPDFIDSNMNVFIGNTMTIPREIGKSFTFLKSRDTQILIEILVDKGSYIVSVIGISH